jgi:hypothetical protein
MSDQILDELRFRGEGTTVDFKAKQYMIARPAPADHEGLSSADLAKLFKNKKSELLKDILAMANAWRDGDAHIVLGFKENPPGPPAVIGLDPDQYFDDGQFQEFIKSHVNKPLRFQYRVCEYQGVAIGLITIPKQTPRPFYSTDDFGVVTAGAVYVRRGSSTHAAETDELVAMGEANVQAAKVPVVDVKLTFDDGAAIGDMAQEARLLVFDNVDELPDLVPRIGGFNQAAFYVPNSLNRRYWRQLARWGIDHNRSIGIKVAIDNKSPFSLTDCKLEIDVLYAAGGGVELQLGSHLPDRPREESTLASEMALARVALAPRDTRFEIERDGVGHVRFGKVRPGETAIAPDSLALMLMAGGQVRITYRLLADELQAPIIGGLAINVELTKVGCDMGTLEAFIEADEESETELPPQHIGLSH